MALTYPDTSQCWHRPIRTRHSAEFRSRVPWVTWRTPLQTGTSTQPDGTNTATGMAQHGHLTSQTTEFKAPMTPQTRVHRTLHKRHPQSLTVSTRASLSETRAQKLTSNFTAVDVEESDLKAE